MKFYKLTEEDLPTVFSMSESELKVYCWLSVNLPFDDSKPIEIDTASLAEQIGISRRSVQRAVLSLKARGIFHLKVKICENPEYQIVQKLQAKLGGQTEVATAVGRIDLLTETEIIEVKQVREWKAALGQVLTYSVFFPEHTKRIHLFGDCTPEKKQVICSTVSSFDVTATFEDGGEN